MYVTEEEASERSRESVESPRSETQKRRTACAWTGSESAFEGEQDRIHAGVVTQGMEGDGVDSLWRAMSVTEGGQGTSAEAKKMRQRVVTAVEERLQAGERQKPLPQGDMGWKEDVQKLVQGRTMGGPPEVEAWAVKNGYRVKVYRETKDGEGYRKIQEYGGEKGVQVGILWKKTRVYEVVWDHNETGGQYNKRGGKSRLGQGGHRLGWAREVKEDTVWRWARLGRRRVERGVRGVQQGTKRNSNARRHGHGRGGRGHWRGRERRQRKGCSWSTCTGRMSTRCGKCCVRWRAG